MNVNIFLYEFSFFPRWGVLGKVQTPLTSRENENCNFFMEVSKYIAKSISIYLGKPKYLII